MSFWNKLKAAITRQDDELDKYVKTSEDAVKQSNDDHRAENRRRIETNYPKGERFIIKSPGKPMWIGKVSGVVEVGQMGSYMPIFVDKKGIHWTSGGAISRYTVTRWKALKKLTDKEQYAVMTKW